MLDKSFYHGQQGECFRQLDKHWQNIKHEFDTQPNKVFLDPKTFPQIVRGLPDDFDDKRRLWPTESIRINPRFEGQSFNDYHHSYSYT